MRTLVHLSELRFGKIDPRRLKPLAHRIRGLQPAVVTVTGDLTAHAGHLELIQAREFLADLPSPRLVVPGWTDIPRFAFWERITGPYERFRREIERKQSPIFSDNAFCVVGLEPILHQPEEEQLAVIHETFASASPGALHVIASRSAFRISPDGIRPVRGKLPTVHEQLFGSRVDLFLCGSARRQPAGNAGSTLFLEPQAGPPGDAFHAIHVTASEGILIERYGWENAVRDFRLAESTRYLREEQRWRVA